MRLWVLNIYLLGIGLTADLPDIDTRRFDCHPEPNASQQNCEARGCIWAQPAKDPNDNFFPWCYQKDGIGYKVTSKSGNTYTLQKNNGPKSPWDTDIAQIQMTSTFIGNVLNIKIGPLGRYEPPVDLPKDVIASTDTIYLQVDDQSDPFSFAVKRTSNDRKLFDTSIGGLIFTDRFIQIATLLPSKNMYGWGENIHKQINHDFSRYLRWGMFARDEPPDSGSLDTKNLYGVQPFYMILESDGNAHGVLILNSNAQDVTTFPAPGLVYRTIGGNLDLYFFPGPTPEDVTTQYYNFIGKPFLPAYWALGYQLCRYGYKDLAEAQGVIKQMRDAGIPMDVAVFDIDYMLRYKDFTTGSGWEDLSSYVDQLHQWGMRVILIWDPAIQVDYDIYQRGVSSGASFIEWEKASQVQNAINDLYPLTKGTNVMLGVVWPDRHVAFPDFLDPSGKTLAWWTNEFKLFHDLVKFDGSWIDMNEPSVFGTNEQHPWYYDNPDHPNAPPLFCPTSGDDAYWENAPYLTQAVFQYGDGSALYTKTLCMLAMTKNRTERFYNTKNLYGWAESKATKSALQSATGERGAVITRSTFPSSGHFAGHWLGDNTARWEDLQTSVIGAQEFNLFGIPYVGSDVCGFIGATNEELCLRWQQMGSFHSFFRNHNDNGSPPQQPSLWPSVANATKKANLFRYRHLPYLYSLHFSASLRGSPVIRPLFFSYPTDELTPSLSYQFMWGPSIMVAPVVNPGVSTLRVYLPSGLWYSIYDYNEYQAITTTGYSDFPAQNTSNLPTFVRGGSIIPRQDPGVTVVDSRKNPFGILAALDGHKATGELFWDDGVSISDSFDSLDYHQITYGCFDTPTTGSVTIEKTKKAKNVPLPSLDEIIVAGYIHTPDFQSFTLNGVKVNVNVQTSSYNSLKQVLTIRTDKLIDLNSADKFILNWNNVITEKRVNQDLR